MAKTKNKRYSKAKPNPFTNKGPTVIPDIEEDQDLGEDVLQKISNNLKSASSIEKECGCSSLAMVAETKVDVILERKLARMAAPLMLDKDLSVSHAAVGALVNVSLISPEICEELVKQDVMTPLCTLLANYNTESEIPWLKRSAINDPIDQKEEIFIKAVTLLWNLCEASEAALKILNSLNVIQLLLSHINVEKYGVDVVACVLQCIYSISENNLPAINAIKERGVDSLFGHLFRSPPSVSKKIDSHSNGVNSKSASDLYLRILACGITISALNDTAASGINDTESNLSSQVLPILMKTATEILDQDQRKLIHDYTSIIPLCEEESDIATNGTHQKELIITEDNMDTENGECKGNVKPKNSTTSPVDQIESMKTKINHILLGQQMTCEILTNLCCDSEYDLESWEDDSDDMNLSDMDEDGCVAMEEKQQVTVSQSKNVSSNIPTVVLEAFISNSLVSKVLAKANFPAENACEILQGPERGRLRNKDHKFGGRTILKMLSTLRSRAFLCVNNMLGSDLSVDDLGGPEALFSVWSNLGLLCFQSTMTNDLSTSSHGAKVDDLELIESATSAMRATTQKLFEAKCHEPFSTLSSSDIQKMIDFGATNPEANIRINLIQIIGNIGTLSTITGASKNLTQHSSLFSQFLLDAAAKDTDIRVVAEALDKIFDMFAEDYTDTLCVRINLVNQLKKILPSMKVKIGLVKKGKREEIEQSFLPVVNIAKTNLIRFIKYKENRQRSDVKSNV